METNLLNGKDKIFEHNKVLLGKKISSFIYIMIIPLMVYSIFIRSIPLLSILMGIGYIIAFSNLFFFISKLYGIKVSKIIFMITIIFIQLLNVFSLSINGITPNWQDILNIISTQLSFFIFFLVMLRIKIERNSLIYFFRKFLFLCLLACFFNILWNLGEFSKFSSVISSYDISFQSFFGNRNQFGSFLFLSNIIFMYYCKYT
ncbi:hypothetical protein, partial [Enterococcus sp. RIT-PI-f]|uniref:hypothetical protein n=1 Tax=Enterococcus sp. RIT-PI-f TaxID=1690244 RepID=UPI0006CD0ECA